MLRLVDRNGPREILPLVAQRLLRADQLDGKPDSCPYDVYTLRYNKLVPEEIEFDWDDGNIPHLAAHQVTPAEFEQVLNNDPVELDYESIDDEDRYRAVGLTSGGRLLSVVFMVRNGRVRGVTAFLASTLDKKAFLERTR